MLTMMTDTGTQMRAAAYEEPHNPTVVTVYADWLQENGKEYEAELIRREAVSDYCQKGPFGWARDADICRPTPERVRAALPTIGGVSYDFRFVLPVAVAHTRLVKSAVRHADKSRWSSNSVWPFPREKARVLSQGCRQIAGVSRPRSLES